MFIGNTSICVLYERYERPVSTYVHDTCELCYGAVQYIAQTLPTHVRSSQLYEYAFTRYTVFHYA